MILRLPRPIQSIDAETFAIIICAMLFSIAFDLIAIGLWFGANSQGVF